LPREIIYGLTVSFNGLKTVERWKPKGFGQIAVRWGGWRPLEAHLLRRRGMEMRANSHRASRFKEGFKRHVKRFILDDSYKEKAVLFSMTRASKRKPAV